MTQEYETMEQQLTRIARRCLEERYATDENGEKQCVCEEHMFLAIALRILDRLESIEKLLQPMETPMDSVCRTLIERKGE
jgi:hypothetical protein